MSLHSREYVINQCADSVNLLERARRIVITNINQFSAKTFIPVDSDAMEIDPPPVDVLGVYKLKDHHDKAHDYIMEAKEQWRIEREIEAGARKKAEEVFIANPLQEVVMITKIKVFKSKGELRCYDNEKLSHDQGNKTNRLLFNVPICISWHNNRAIEGYNIPWPKDNEHKKYKWSRAQHRDDSILDPRAKRPIKEGVTWIRDFEGLYEFLLLLPQIKKWRPELACDCEGVNLGRNGTLTHLSIAILSFKHTYIICLHELNRGVFDGVETITTEDKYGAITSDTYIKEYFAKVFDAHVYGTSLRQVLESEEIGQLWFDVRNDADALWTHHRIKLGHVFDIQILELMSRYGSRKSVTGLAVCVREYGLKFLHKDYQREWLRAKNEGRDFFHNTYDDNPLGWKVLEEIPLPKVVEDYTAGDVPILFRLYEYFIPRLELMSRYLEMPNMLPLLQMVDDASRTRSHESRSVSYNPEEDEDSKKRKTDAPIPPADLEQIDLGAGSVNHPILSGSTSWLEDPNGVQGEAWTDGTYKNPYQIHTLVHGRYRGTAGVAKDETQNYKCKVNNVRKMRRPITWFPPDAVMAALAALWTNAIKLNLGIP